MYLIFVGKPATGKGLVINTVQDLLGYHKVLYDSKDDELLAKAEKLTTGKGLNKAGHKYFRDELLFPIAANSTTFEAILATHSSSTRTIKVAPCVAAPGGVYSHNSLVFIVEELSALFKKQSEKIVNYFIAVYDGRTYTNVLKHDAPDIIEDCCLSLLGGTQPDFLQDSFEDRLLLQGFSSRTLFIHEDGPRFAKFDIDELSAEQYQAKKDLLDWLKQLSKLFGKVTFSSEAHEYLREYFEDGQCQKDQLHAHPSLESYYGRKNANVRKLAMAIHFADNLDMELSLYDCKRALETLTSLEPKMAMSFVLASTDPIHRRAKEIMGYLSATGPKTIIELLKRFISTSARPQEISECLEYLIKMGDVRSIKKDNLVYYEVIKKS